MKKFRRFFAFTRVHHSVTRLILEIFSGEKGIRTLDTLLEYTHFPGVPLQPLEHLSVFAIAKI